MQVYYTIDKTKDGKIPEGWKGGVGYVTKDMASAHIPPPSDDNLVLVCGPPPMYKALSGEKAKDKSQGEVSAPPPPLPAHFPISRPCAFPHKCPALSALL